MKPLLSSDALPEATIEELRAAGRRRSLAGLELTLGAGHHHGADASPCAIRHEAGVDCFPATPTDLPIAWLLLPEEAPLAMRSIWSSAAYGLGAGVLLRRATVERPAVSRTALLHGTDPYAACRAGAWAEDHGAQTAWEVRSAAFDPDRWAAVLDTTGPHLAHIRLLGAGPEAEAGGGASDGTGWLLSRLALRGYGGTVALAPSSPDHLTDWGRWLRRGRGWGCGTAAEKKAAAERKAARTQPPSAETIP